LQEKESVVAAGKCRRRRRIPHIKESIVGEVEYSLYYKR
jgi:hypothetical protein